MTLVGDFQGDIDFGEGALVKGRVAWVYNRAPALVEGQDAPACSRDELLISVSLSN